MPRAAIKNLGASVRQRLLNIADARDEPFDLLLTQYGLERILYRLSVSDWAAEFTLKGALLFKLWNQLPRRPTRDADLLGGGPAELERLRKIFRTLCVSKVQDDGLAFDPESVRVEEIRENNMYQGIRVRLFADLDGARVPVQVDVGFGDVVTPGPEEVDFPTLLEFPTPRLRVYPVYTVVAEKLQALVVFGVANSRMKDYYDLWILAENIAFELELLRDAIKATFERRKTEIPENSPIGLTDEFFEDNAKRRQWAAFVSKSGLDASGLSLRNVVEKLSDFVMTPMRAASSNVQIQLRDNFWPPGGPWQ